MADNTKPEVIDWRIWISGYGEFEFRGTEAEAEDMRAHKAQWERGQGRKWRADLLRESDRLTAELVGLWSSGEGAPMSLLRSIAKARDEEAGFSDDAVLQFVPQRGGWLRSREIAERSPFSVRGVRKALSRLRQAGRVDYSAPYYRAAPSPTLLGEGA